jgi:hypothetical protein
MTKPQITIRLGAGNDDVTVDGHTFDRSKMTRPEKNKLTRMLVGGLTQAGYFNAP